MEEQTVIIWHNGQPAMISEPIAIKYGLTRGSVVASLASFESILEENNTRAACSIEAQRNGETCLECGS